MRFMHSMYFSRVFSMISAGSSGGGVTPSSLFSISQSRANCLSKLFGEVPTL